MDVKLLLLVSLIAVVGVYSKPTGQSKDEADSDGAVEISDEKYYEILKKSIKTLNQQVKDFKEKIQKRTAVKKEVEKVKEDESALEAELEKAVQAEKNLENSVSDEKPKEKDASAFFNDDADFTNYDFDDYETTLKKTEEKKKKKDEATKAKKDAKPVVQKKKDSKPVVKDVVTMGEHLDKPVKDEIVTPQVLDTKADEKREAMEVKGIVKDIKKDIKDITSSFLTLKHDYKGLNKKEIDHTTSLKFETVKKDIKDVISEFNDIREKFHKKDQSQDEVDAPLKDSDAFDSTPSEMKDVLNLMKGQLMDAGSIIEELKDKAKMEKDLKIAADEAKEAERIKTMKDALAKAKKDAAERKAKKEAEEKEAERIKTMKDALAKAKKDAAERKAKKEAEEKAKKDAEAKAKKDAAEKAKKEAEEKAKKEADKDELTIQQEDDAVRMDALKEELKDVLNDIKSVKDQIAHEKLSSKREVKTKHGDDLNDLKEELDMIKAEVLDIKGKHD